MGRLARIGIGLCLAGCALGHGGMAWAEQERLHAALAVEAFQLLDELSGWCREGNCGPLTGRLLAGDAAGALEWLVERSGEELAGRESGGYAFLPPTDGAAPEFEPSGSRFADLLAAESYLFDHYRDHHFSTHLEGPWDELAAAFGVATSGFELHGRQLTSLNHFYNRFNHNGSRLAISIGYSCAVIPRHCDHQPDPLFKPWIGLDDLDRYDHIGGGDYVAFEICGGTPDQVMCEAFEDADLMVDRDRSGAVDLYRWPSGLDPDEYYRRHGDNDAAGYFFYPVDAVAETWHGLFENDGHRVRNLGGTIHCLADANQPHHAAGHMGNFHRQWEAFVAARHLDGAGPDGLPGRDREERLATLGGLVEEYLAGSGAVRIDRPQLWIDLIGSAPGGSLSFSRQLTRRLAVDSLTRGDEDAVRHAMHAVIDRLADLYCRGDLIWTNSLICSVDRRLPPGSLPFAVRDRNLDPDVYEPYADLLSIDWPVAMESLSRTGLPTTLARLADSQLDRAVAATAVFYLYIGAVYGDIDRDGLAGGQDNCLLEANSNQADLDRDGIGDACDDDRDGDGLSYAEEGGCDLNRWLADTDRDGVCSCHGSGCGGGRIEQMVACSEQCRFLDARTDGDRCLELCLHVDNCPLEFNPDQFVCPGREVGVACDAVLCIDDRPGEFHFVQTDAVLETSVSGSPTGCSAGAMPEVRGLAIPGGAVALETGHRGPGQLPVPHAERIFFCACPAGDEDCRQMACGDGPESALAIERRGDDRWRPARWVVTVARVAGRPLVTGPAAQACVEEADSPNSREGRVACGDVPDVPYQADGARFWAAVWLAAADLSGQLADGPVDARLGVMPQPVGTGFEPYRQVVFSNWFRFEHQQPQERRYLVGGCLVGQHDVEWQVRESLLGGGLRIDLRPEPGLPAGESVIGAVERGLGNGIRIRPQAWSISPLGSLLFGGLPGSAYAGRLAPDRASAVEAVFGGSFADRLSGTLFVSRSRAGEGQRWQVFTHKAYSAQPGQDLVTGRVGAALAFEPESGDLLLYGGRDRQRLYADLWRLRLTVGETGEVADVGWQPQPERGLPARSEALLFSVGPGRVVVAGGNGHDGPAESVIIARSGGSTQLPLSLPLIAGRACGAVAGGRLVLFDPAGLAFLSVDPDALSVTRLDGLLGGRTEKAERCHLISSPDGNALYLFLDGREAWFVDYDNFEVEPLVVHREEQDDGVPAGSDNCPDAGNPDQADLDLDGLGDACDEDDDGDGTADQNDICPGVPDSLQSDLDLDGRGDACDPCPLDPDDDLDRDGVCGDRDVCPDLPDPRQADCDRDGQGDACDPDACVSGPWREAFGATADLLDRGRTLLLPVRLHGFERQGRLSLPRRERLLVRVCDCPDGDSHCRTCRVTGGPAWVVAYDREESFEPNPSERRIVLRLEAGQVKKRFMLQLSAGRFAWTGGPLITRGLTISDGGQISLTPAERPAPPVPARRESPDTSRLQVR